MKNGPEDCPHPEICPMSLGRKRTEIRHSVPPLQEATGNPWLQATQNNSKPNPVPPLWEQTKVASPLLRSALEVH